MPMPKDEMQSELAEAWRTYLDALEKSLQKIEADIREASEMADQCTSEWCAATEHYIDQIGNMLFSISEPRWSSPEDSRRIRDLKRRLHDMYAEYKQVYRTVAG